MWAGYAGGATQHSPCDPEGCAQASNEAGKSRCLPGTSQDGWWRTSVAMSITTLHQLHKLETTIAKHQGQLSRNDSEMQRRVHPVCSWVPWGLYVSVI